MKVLFIDVNAVKKKSIIDGNLDTDKIDVNALHWLELNNCTLPTETNYLPSDMELYTNVL